METLQRLGWKYTFTHRPTHTYIMLSSHSRGSLINLQSFFPSSFGGSSWTIQLLPANGVSQGSVGYLLYINKGNYQLNWESSVASSAMPLSSVLYTRILFWHALVKQCTGTGRIKGSTHRWASILKTMPNTHLRLRYRFIHVANGSTFYLTTSHKTLGLQTYIYKLGFKN